MLDTRHTLMQHFKIWGLDLVPTKIIIIIKII